MRHCGCGCCGSARLSLSFALVTGHRPRLWAGTSGRGWLAALEAGWAAAREDRWRALTAAVTRGGRGPAAAAAPASAGVAGPVGPRVHPLQRAAAAGRAGAGHGLDEVGVLMVGIPDSDTG
jgi:hypothetical protein